MRIFQYVDEYHPSDGIGNDIRGIEEKAKELNITTFIVCRKNFLFEAKNVLRIQSIPTSENFDIHILHFGGSGFPLEIFENIKGRKILRFHNLTPLYFFKNWLTEKQYTSLQKSDYKSIFDLFSIIQSFDEIWYVSEFNKQELKSKFKIDLSVKERVIPIFRKYNSSFNLIKNPHSIGFVGRFVPNKKIEDLVLLLNFLKKTDKRFHLKLFGKRLPIFTKYFSHIQSLAKELFLNDSMQIIENCSDEELSLEISKLGFYVSMSEHEGFGIPLLEAFANQVPVISYLNGSAREVMKGSGILFKEKNFQIIAELIAWLFRHPDKLNQIQKKELAVASEYNNYPFREIFLDLCKSNV